MIDEFSFKGLEPDIEAMLRAAADYPRVSPDLRPRVLEEARASHRRRVRSGWFMMTAAMMLMFLGAIHVMESASFRVAAGADVAARHPRDRANPVVGSGGLLASTNSGLGTVASGRDWALVDRFSRLREHHLRMLRRAF